MYHDTLVRSVADNDSSLNATTNEGEKAEINNLMIEECEKHCDHRGQSPNVRSKNQRRRANQNKRAKGKASRRNAGGRQQVLCWGSISLKMWLEMSNGENAWKS